jgi:hypothetical protein
MNIVIARRAGNKTRRRYHVVRWSDLKVRGGRAATILWRNGEKFVVLYDVREVP